jgi:beta-galactosidase
VDVITEAKDFSPYPYLVAPAYQLIDREIIGRFTKCGENGGTLILTCRTGYRRIAAVRFGSLSGPNPF